MKIIFLDIDGVLNSDGKDSNSCCGAYKGIDKPRVQRLASIVQQTNAIIVLTSDWKYHWARDTEDEFGKYLNTHLQKKGNLYITDKTAEPAISLRGLGIREYLSRYNNIKSWVVLDDRIFDDYEKRGILPHLVLTDHMKGLTDKDAAAAVKILNEGFIGPYIATKDEF